MRQPLLRSQPRRRMLLFPLLGLVITGLAVGGLFLASHYWSQPIGEGVTTMTVEVDRRGPTRPNVEVVETVGRYCSLNSGTDVHFVGVAPGAGRSTQLRVSPLLDDDAQKRYIGCLEDAVLEWHRLTVTETRLFPGTSTAQQP